MAACSQALSPAWDHPSPPPTTLLSHCQSNNTTQQLQLCPPPNLHPIDAARHRPHAGHREWRRGFFSPRWTWTISQRLRPPFTRGGKSSRDKTRRLCSSRLQQRRVWEGARDGPQHVRQSTTLDGEVPVLMALCAFPSVANQRVSARMAAVLGEELRVCFTTYHQGDGERRPQPSVTLFTG